MFRLSRLIKLAKAGNGTRPASSLPMSVNGAPIVIWNLTKSCNLSCVHCYASADSGKFDGELSSKDALRVLGDLNDAGIKMLILSGGEPLMRPDIFEIAKKAKDMGMHVSLSSNGTLMNSSTVQSIRETGFDYVGVSLDGDREIHDRFRGVKGSYDKALAGLLGLRKSGIKTGVRFTLTAHNYADLPDIFALAERYEIEKIYLSHLVYAGRGKRAKQADIHHDEIRKIMEYIFEKAESYIEKGLSTEIVTGNNDADGVFMVLRLLNKDPETAERLYSKLKRIGGNSAGVGVANIDSLGFVHPDPLVQNVTLGNVQNTPFKVIWNDSSNKILRSLRERPRKVNGRCGSCCWLNICGGNNRERAFRITGDFWGSDPACYLKDSEINIEVTCDV